MKNLSQMSGMPQMGRAFAGWTQRITLQKIIQNVVDSLVVSNTMSFSFTGVIQPLSPKSIALKPEGQRAWEWLQIHCVATSMTPIPVSTALTFDTPGNSWDTPGQQWDARNPDALAVIWKNLNVNDRIIYNGRVYKIMANKDYSLNNYIEYHAIEDYQG